MNEIITLNQALCALQELNASLRLTTRSIAIWSPHKQIPSKVRRMILDNKQEVRQRIEACSILCCPNPRYHQHEWGFDGRAFTIDNAVCGICKRLAYLEEPRKSKANFDKIEIQQLKMPIIS